MRQATINRRPPGEHDKLKKKKKMCHIPEVGGKKIDTQKFLENYMQGFGDKKG